jgi:lysophospholipase L1-like esterase
MPAANSQPKTYLALGDSMSIDQYTGVKGGGAVSQFHKWLGDQWTLIDKSADMCRMRYVPRNLRGDVITLTIGGNDLIADAQHYLEGGMADFAEEHLALLQAIRQANPTALLIVGNVYAPQSPLPENMSWALDAANGAIAANTRSVAASLADIREAFRGHEQDFLCYDIEPSLQGATVIAGLFQEAARQMRLV